MDREEKLKYEQGIEEYFDKHKVYDLFEKLFKELIVNKPEKPIDYLIDHLEKKEQKRIFVTGYPGTNRKDLCQKLSKELNYSFASCADLLNQEISTSSKIQESIQNHLLVNDDIIIEKIRDQLIKFEENKESYIIEGFPKNRTQAIFLQSVGLLPDNVIILTTSKENAEKFIKSQIKDGGKCDCLAANSYDEANLNIRAVEDVFKGFYFEINVDKYSSQNEILSEVTRLLKFKAKSNAARMPPRIVLAGPSHMKKEKVGEELSKKLQIIHISIRDLLNLQIKMKNENSKEVLNSLEKNELVNDKIILKVLEDRLHCSDAIINGWIITGFPMNDGQFNFVKNMKSSIKPSLLCYLKMDDQKLVDDCVRTRYDMKTGISYKINGKKYNELNPNIKERLVEKKENEENKIKERISNWRKIEEKLQADGWIQFDGKEKTKNICELIEDKIGYNS